MSTGELRRGPGWWMDSDGIWNPPELWPEQTPPLPNWRRSDAGTWLAPDEPPAPSHESAQPVVANTPEPVVQLRYTTYDPVPQPDDDGRQLRKAASAAAIAAIIALMVACGLVVLLLLF